MLLLPLGFLYRVAAKNWNLSKKGLVILYVGHQVTAHYSCRILLVKKQVAGSHPLLLFPDEFPVPQNSIGDILNPKEMNVLSK